ncbi:NfeD-like C-terminal, partner-binding [Halobacillus alkaliphilus]|uniref:NfeD-like C-terminal, partner-binding n=1 Tax=Halobacillus alkaliphilus TaxID=396056 RepID=A0A1I2JIJ7_9BACI|nr:NfeD family protein [Halobacillus alkaliphilus]SFF53800.1 NfeD-like C-terminal, partner-binding [Halobacillus alkaliphilus]
MFAFDWIALFITFLGTMFLIGELLVNMKGIFAIIGFGFITVYFSSYLATDMFIVMMLVYFLGIILMVIDGKLINDGTLATIGAAVMVIAVGFSAPNWVAGLYSVIGVILGGAASLLFLKVFKHRKMWTKITLRDQLSSEMGYNSMKESYQFLVNKKGKALTDMRPVGTIKIEEEDYSAVSNGQWISKDDEIKVVSVDGTRILVKKL